MVEGERTEAFAERVGALVADGGEVEPAAFELGWIGCVECEGGGVDGVGEQLAGAGGAEQAGDAQRLGGFGWGGLGEADAGCGGLARLPAGEQEGSATSRRIRR